MTLFDEFLDRKSEAWPMKKTNKLDILKIKNLSSAKDTTKKIKRLRKSLQNSYLIKVWYAKYTKNS